MGYADEVDEGVFWSHVHEQPNGCWEWDAYTRPSGVSTLTVRSSTTKSGKRVLYAHRVAWTLVRGEIPAGKEITHLGPAGCGNRVCINPYADHAEAVSHRDVCRNGASPAGINARKTECSKGHSYAIFGRNDRRGSRGCRECERLAYHDSKRAVA
jgi:hypothetical protein